MSYKILPVIAACVFAVSASAVTQTYTISGVMTDIRNSGAGIAFGTPFAASYTHDDSGQPGALIEPGRISFQGGAFDITAGSLVLGSATTSLQVLNDYSSVISGYNLDDGFFVSGYVYDSNRSNFYLIQFDLWDFNGNALSTLSVPSQAQFLQLADYGRFWIRRFENGLETGVAAGQLQNISAIPEPHSALLFGVGALVAVGYRCMQRNCGLTSRSS